MPELPITENGHPKFLASMEVLAVMAYPKISERIRRQEFLASFEADQIIELHKLGVVETFPKDWQVALGKKTVEALSLLSDAPSKQQQMKTMGGKARHAWIAGEVLRFLLTASEHHPQVDVNIDKVIGMLGRHYQANPSPGPRPIAGEESVRKYWKAFRSVSHLHLSLNSISRAVLGVPKDLEELIKRGSQNGEIMHKDLISVLTLAEKFRRAAEERGFFRRTEAWSVPDDYKLIPEDAELGRILRPLPADIVEALQAHEPRYAGRSAAEDSG